MSSEEPEQGQTDGVDLAYGIDKLQSFKAVAQAPEVRDTAPAQGRKTAARFSATAIKYHWPRQTMYYGLDNGELHCLRLTVMQREHAPKAPPQFRYLGSHKGSVTCIDVTSRDLAKLVTQPYLVSGSADSTIKIWEYQGKLLTHPAVCVQTLYGHEGTVTCLVSVGDYIVSGSTDRTIRLWKAAEGRNVLAYPWFEMNRVISSMEGWVTCMAYHRVSLYEDSGAIFAADDTGAIVHIIPQASVDPDNRKNALVVGFTTRGQLESASGRRSTPLPAGVPPSSLGKASTTTLLPGGGALPGMSASGFERTHDRSVSALVYDNRTKLLITLAYDNQLRVCDTHQRTTRFTFSNENGGRFTGCHYGHQYNEVLAVDTKGYLSIYSLLSGALQASKQLCEQPISAILACQQRDVYAILNADNEFQLWRVEHDLEYNMIRCNHDKPIVALHCVSGGLPRPGDEKGGGRASHDFRIFSASMDNSIRIWDPTDLRCLRIMHEQDMPEISAMLYFEPWDKVVTGHENGEVRLWNTDTCNCAFVLEGHTNTVTALCTSVVGKNQEHLTSVSYDGQVILWDVRQLRGQPPHIVARFRAHGAGSAGGLKNADVAGTPRPPSMEPCFSTLSGVGRPFIPPPSPGSAPLLPRSSSGQRYRNSGGGLAEPQSPSPSQSALFGEASFPPPTRSWSDAAPPPSKSGGDGLAAPVLYAPGTEPEVLCVMYDYYKGVIITGGADRLVKVWNAHTRAYVGKHVGHTDAVNALAVDANLLFSAGDDCTILVWDLIPPSLAAASSLALRRSGGGKLGSARRGEAADDGDGEHPIDQLELAQHGDVSMRLDVHVHIKRGGFTSQPLRVLSGVHSQPITAMAMMPGLGLLASCGLDGLLVYWCYVSGEVRERFQTAEELSCLAVRYDAQEVLVGTNSANILRFFAGTKETQNLLAEASKLQLAQPQSSFLQRLASLRGNVEPGGGQIDVPS